VPIEIFESSSGRLEVFDKIADTFFIPKRIYLLSDISELATRGEHAHKKLMQIFLCPAGQFEIELDNGFAKFNFQLKKGEPGLFVPSGFWRNLTNFSDSAICLVLASENFEESDYIRDYHEFMGWVGEKN
jgi:hypothetical protein